MTNAGIVEEPLLVNSISPQRKASPRSRRRPTLPARRPPARWRSLPSVATSVAGNNNCADFWKVGVILPRAVPAGCLPKRREMHAAGLHCD
jgi:hypothetical protein